MSDLNEQIQSWRKSVSHHDSFQQQDIDELEGHLRDKISELSAAGLSDEEAFLLAVHRMGSPDALSLEFSKVNRLCFWGNRVQWIWAGYIFGTIIVTFVSGMTSSYGSNPTGWALARLGIALVFYCLILGLFYLIPYTGLLTKPKHESLSDKRSPKSKTAFVAAIVSFFLISIPVFFCLSVTIAPHLAPDLRLHQFWLGGISEGTVGFRIVVLMIVCLPPAVAFGLYTAKETFYRWGKQMMKSDICMT